MNEWKKHVCLEACLWLWSAVGPRPRGLEIGVAWNLSELVPHKGDAGWGQDGRPMPGAWPGPSCQREADKSTQNADDSGEVESTGHTHNCDISGGPSVPSNTEIEAADSVGWPWTMKPSLSSPYVHQLLILHTLEEHLPWARQAASTEKAGTDPASGPKYAWGQWGKIKMERSWGNRREGRKPLDIPAEGRGTHPEKNESWECQKLKRKYPRGWGKTWAI